MSTGNTVSDSDVNIYGGNVPAYGLNANSIGDWGYRQQHRLGRHFSG